MQNGDIILEVNRKCVNDYFSCEEIVKDKLKVPIKVGNLMVHNEKLNQIHDRYCGMAKFMNSKLKLLI